MPIDKDGTNHLNNIRIAKNTLLLYFRMMVLMLVNLYVSRVVLEALGIEDYGIYHVVTGFVSMFSVMTTSMSTAYGRFLAVEIGKDKQIELRKIFQTSLAIQLMLSLLIVVIAESLGIWVLNEVLIIPHERLHAAFWCFQLSVLSFVIGLVCIPYQSTIIAHEQMRAFAFISILEAVGKLAVAFVLMYSQIDRLVLFALLMVALSFIIRFVYGWYCGKHFDETSMLPSFHKDVFRKIFAFAGWNYLGIIASMVRNQGLNLLMNVFFGPAVNAARGVAVKAESAIYQFVTNFATAFNPSIIKSYSREDFSYMHMLICRASRFSFFLFLLISLPVLLESKTVLHVWLKTVPCFSDIFLRLTILFSLLRSLSIPLITSANATGNIKEYQLTVSLISLLTIFPISYVLYAMGYAPYWGYIVCIVIEVLLLTVRLYKVHKLTGLKIEQFVNSVLARVLVVSLLSVIMPIGVVMMMESGLVRFLLIALLSFGTTIIAIYYFGLENQERELIIKFLRKYHA